MQKTVKIFLASSIEDLKYDRLEIGDFFRQLNEIYLYSGIHFSLIKCEDYDNAIAAEGKQTQYDKEIRGCDLVFFLFFRKVGEYTKHEFEVALEEFKKTNSKPKIITYFKQVESAADINAEVKAFMAMLDGELRHYYNIYGNIDTLKLGMLMQIKLMKLDSSEIKIEDGGIKLNGQRIAASANIPCLNANKELMELTERKAELRNKLTELRAVYLGDPSEENEQAFFEASTDFKEISKELTKLEKNALDLMTTVAEITSDGRVLTHRQKEALKFFYQGDYASSQAILEDSERENELERAEDRAEISLNEIRGHIQEDLLWIEMELSHSTHSKRTELISAKFQKLEKLVDKYGIEIDALYEYANFLYLQDDYEKMTEIANRALWHYSKPGYEVNKCNRSDLYELLAYAHMHYGDHDEAEKMFKQALDGFAELNNESRDAYSYRLADIYISYADLCKELGSADKAEAMYKNAVELHEEIYANRDCEDIHTLVNIAFCYHSLGSFYGSAHRYDEAEKMYTISLNTYSRVREEYSQIHPKDVAPIDEVIDSTKNVLEVLKKVKAELELLNT